MELSWIQSCRKKVVELQECQKNMSSELEEVKKRSGKLFFKNLRLSRSVQECFDRNIALEVRLRDYKRVKEDLQVFRRVIGKTKEDLKELRRSAVLALREYQEDVNDASLMLKYLCSSFTPQRAVQTPKTMGERSFSEEDERWSDLTSINDVSGEIPPLETWKYTCDEMVEWYMTCAISSDTRVKLV